MLRNSGILWGGTGDLPSEIKGKLWRLANDSVGFAVGLGGTICRNISKLKKEDLDEIMELAKRNIEFTAELAKSISRVASIDEKTKQEIIR